MKVTMWPQQDQGWVSRYRTSMTGRHVPAVELATPDEAVRMSLGGGLRPALREVGGTLLGLAAVSLLSILFRGGWSVDVPITSALIAVSLTVGYAGWVVS